MPIEYLANVQSSVRWYATQNSFSKAKIYDKCSIQEMQRVDRELSSELVEYPINPVFLNVLKPMMGGFNPLFHLQVNGEALWQWRRLCPNEMFDALQSNLAKIGYILTSCSLVRIGTVIYGRVAYLVKKVNLATNCNVRRPVRSECWCCIALHYNKILQGPEGIIVSPQTSFGVRSSRIHFSPRDDVRGGEMNASRMNPKGRLRGG